MNRGMPPGPPLTRGGPRFNTTPGTPPPPPSGGPPKTGGSGNGVALFVVLLVAIGVFWALTRNVFLW